MEQVIFKKGLYENLPTTAETGTLCFATDKGVIRFFSSPTSYIDINGTITEEAFDNLVKEVDEKVEMQVEEKEECIVFNTDSGV